MRNPLHATLELLSSSANPHALDILLAGLDSSDERVRNGAAMAVAKRRSPRGHFELVRRLDRLTPAMRDEIAKHSTGMENSLRQCLIHGDPQMQKNALEMVRFVEDFGQVPTLIGLLENRAHPLRPQIQSVLQDLIDRLHDRRTALAGNAVAAAQARDLERVVEQTIVALDEGAFKYPAHESRTVVEGLLSLVDVEHFSTRKLLRQLGHPAREAAEGILQSSTHPGVLRLVRELMSVNFPPQKAVAAVRTRSDPEFISHLLGNWPKRLTPVEQENYTKVDSVSWLATTDRLMEIPPAHHETLVRFVHDVGLPPDEKRRVIEWVMHNGSPEGKKAATEVLGHSDAGFVKDVVVEGLYSDDPNIQAWATQQLRATGVPETFSLLIDRIDSPLAEVKQAAREQLEDFNLRRLMDLFDQLKPEVLMAAGRLIRKIDPQTLDKLQQEMASPMRSKRIRSARLAVAIGVADQVLPAYLQQLTDPDAMVRRTAVEILGSLGRPEVAASLLRMREDASPRVREEAERALARQAQPPPAIGDELLAELAAANGLQAAGPA